MTEDVLLLRCALCGAHLPEAALRRHGMHCQSTLTSSKAVASPSGRDGDDDGGESPVTPSPLVNARLSATFSFVAFNRRRRQTYPVCVKQEATQSGGRQRDAEEGTTLKLHKDSQYRISVDFKGNRSVKGISMVSLDRREVTLDATSTLGLGTPKVHVEGDWLVNALTRSSSRGDRHLVSIDVCVQVCHGDQVAEAKLQACVQAKVYGGSGGQHLANGIPLASLRLQCDDLEREAEVEVSWALKGR